MSEQAASTADLEARIQALEAQLVERDSALEAARIALAEERAQNVSNTLLIEKLKAQLARLKRLAFGKSSEKLDQEIAQLELTLEELEELEEAVAASRSGTATARPAPVRALPPHLPREDVVHEPDSCSCPECGGELRRMGEDVDELLDIVPASWRVIRQVRPKYTCRACAKIVQAPVPAKPIARGKATFGTLAHVVVAKHDHHLPHYRQAEMMAAQGIDIDRSTLARWSGQAAGLLDPIVSRIREEGLKASKIHTDDTPVPVLDPGRGRTKTGRLWTYVVDDRGCGAATPPMVWYRFTADRSGSHPAGELATFSGFLQADAYSGYDQLYRTNRVIEVGCWGHFRRKIFDLHEQKATTLTTDLLRRIAALYRIEEEIRGQPPDERRSVRHARTRPLVNDLHAALQDALRRLSPRSEMAKAITYGTKRWSSLTRFLDDGRLEIDNLIAERSLRGIALGRKNWLFAGSNVGGERAAAIYTVIETCKLNGFDPQAYIADVIHRIADNWPASRWDELMPWNWQPLGAAAPTALAA